jgi:hypothetical protein
MRPRLAAVVQASTLESLARRCAAVDTSVAPNAAASLLAKASCFHTAFQHPCVKGVRVDFESRGGPSGTFHAVTGDGEPSLVSLRAASIARHSRVNSSMIASIRNARPSAVRRRLKDAAVVVDLHELGPVGGRSTGRRDWRRLERFAEECQVLLVARMQFQWWKCVRVRLPSPRCLIRRVLASPGATSCGLVALLTGLP